MKFTCIDLIPQSSCMVVKDKAMSIAILRLVKFSVTELLESLEHFYLFKKYHYFDPHVGENCCQARAVQMLDLAYRSKKADFSYVRRINEIKKYLLNLARQLEKLPQESSALKKHIDLVSFLTERECLLQISREESYLAMVHFLSKYKSGSSEGETFIDHKKICAHALISRKQAKKVARYYQLFLSKNSCEDIIEKSSALGKLAGYTAILGELQLNDDDGRYVLPCYFVNEMLLEHLKRQKYPILVITHRTCPLDSAFSVMLFLFDADSQQFKLVTERLQEFWDVPCFIVKGRTVTQDHESDEHYKKRFLLLGFEKIYLLNVAVHPQYSGNKLATYCKDPFLALSGFDLESQSMRSTLFNQRVEALKFGCHIERPALFYTQHTFCGKPSSLLQEIKDEAGLQLESCLNQEVSESLSDFV